MAVLGGLLLLLALLLLLVAGLYCCYVRRVHAAYDHIPGAPRESFLLGHLPIFWRMMKKQEFLHDLFLEWTKKYGPIIRVNAFHRVSVLILSPEGVKEFLMSPEYPKDRLVYGRIFNLFGVRFLGNGLVTDRNYEHWHKQRKVMDPAFSRTYLIGVMETFNEKAEELMEKLEEKADGKTEFSMLTMMSRVTLDVIAKVAFGLELNALRDDRTPFPHAVTMIMKGMTEMRIPFVKYMPGKQKMIKEVQESVRLLRRVGKECIEKRREAIQSEKEMPTDILTQILKGDALEETRDDENILDNFITFFVAGHETTANQLSFTVMALSQHPEIMERVQAEVDEVLGAKRDIEYEDLGKLKYLSQVLKESMRLYPPVPGTVRWTGKETVIEGVRIPANTTLLFSTYVMGRMERYFKDPLCFDPDRFRKDAPKPYYSYFPFSLGPRSCIGQVFAQMEAKVVMAKLLQRFEFQLVPGQSFKLLDTGTLRPLDGVMYGKLSLAMHRAAALFSPEVTERPSAAASCTLQRRTVSPCSLSQTHRCPLGSQPGAQISVADKQEEKQGESRCLDSLGMGGNQAGDRHPEELCLAGGGSSLYMERESLSYPCWSTTDSSAPTPHAQEHNQHQCQEGIASGGMNADRGTNNTVLIAGAKCAKHELGCFVACRAHLSSSHLPPHTTALQCCSGCVQRIQSLHAHHSPASISAGNVLRETSRFLHLAAHTALISLGRTPMTCLVIDQCLVAAFRLPGDTGAERAQRSISFPVTSGSGCEFSTYCELRKLKIK